MRQGLGPTEPFCFIGLLPRSYPHRQISFQGIALSTPILAGEKRVDLRLGFRLNRRSPTTDRNQNLWKSDRLKERLLKPLLDIGEPRIIVEGGQPFMPNP